MFKMFALPIRPKKPTDKSNLELQPEKEADPEKTPPLFWTDKTPERAVSHDEPTPESLRKRKASQLSENDISSTELPEETRSLKRNTPCIPLFTSPCPPVIPALPLQSSLQASTKGKRSATLPTSKLPKQKYKKRAARPKTILNSPPAALALSSPSLPVSPAEPSQAPRKHNKSPALYTPERVERREPKLYFGWDNEVFLDFQSGSGTRRLPISELGSRRVVLDADKLQVGEGHKR